MDISIIIPFLNEEESLPELYERIIKVMESMNKTFEVLFIDDGSTDNSSKIVEKFAIDDSRITLLSLKRNFGKSNALMVGFSRAVGNRAITMDADLQDLPENIPDLLAKSQFDLVSGWRKNRQDSNLKKSLSRIFNKLISLFFDMNCRDLNCGFKVYCKDLYKTLNLYGDLHRMTLVLAKMEGFTYTEVPISHAQRKFGFSKYPLFRARGLWDILSLSFMTSLQTRPFHFFAPYSIILLIFASVLFLLLVTGILTTPVAHTVFIVIFFLGIYFFIVGLQFETQLNIYRKNFPVEETIRYVVSHTKG